mmetsp:Transcript_105374/g.304141  ORF Transcript_105374/g.304141 Transcript_105374/m.304141 type:complete len:148 (+) Transcript_105374:80-523(+)
MSVVGVVGAQPLAKLADTYGKVPTIIGGIGILGASVASIPFCSASAEMWTLIPTLGCWSLGTTMLGTSPMTHTVDIAKLEHRAHATSLLRTSGDIGMLSGALLSGMVADASSMDMAMRLNGGMLLAGSLWYAYRNSSPTHAHTGPPR